MRHVLNVVIMAFTVAIVVLFTSVVLELVKFARSSSDKAVTRILIWPKLSGGAGNDLPMAWYPMFQKIDGVKVVQCQKFMFGRIPNGPTYIISGEEESGVDLNRDIFPVEQDVFEAWKKERPLGAIVTETTAKELNLQIGQVTEVPTGFGPLKLKIVGFSKGGLVARRIAPHFDYLQQFAGNSGTCIYRLFVAPSDYERVARAVLEQTKNSPTPAQAMSDAQLSESWARSVSAVPTLLGFLGLF
ncbi:MAG: hypothetical protein H0T42_14145, partial [Deltaproteobacteria bacterium]|nr:hypothetical protein [Deltaproteobacteria bacterium]